MRLGEKGRKKFIPEFRSYPTPPRKFKKNCKKIQKIKKPLFWQYLKPKHDEIGHEREKNILGPNTADTRPRQENSKKNSEKIKKI